MTASFDLSRPRHAKGNAYSSIMIVSFVAAVDTISKVFLPTIVIAENNQCVVGESHL